MGDQDPQTERSRRLPTVLAWCNGPLLAATILATQLVTVIAVAGIRGPRASYEAFLWAARFFLLAPPLGTVAGGLIWWRSISPVSLARNLRILWCVQVVVVALLVF